VSRIETLKTRFRSRAAAVFHPREIHLHDANGVKHIRISTRVQAVAAGVVAVLAGWTAIATAGFLFGNGPLSTASEEIAQRDQQIAMMRADVERLRASSHDVAHKIEERQQFLIGLLSGQTDAGELAQALPASMKMNGKTPESLSRIADSQLAFVDQATGTAQQRFRETQMLLKRVGLSPRRFIRQSNIAVGGPYEPIGSQDSDPAFRKLFVSWNKLDTLQKGMLSVPALQPVTQYRITSGFGVRSDPFNGSAALHTGIDLAGPMGEEIHASADGVVEKAGWGGGYGNMIDIAHGHGIETRYGHLSAILVKPGQKVKRGDVIARMGSTGRSTGSHLHYEVRIDGRAVNPVPFLESAQALAEVHDRALTGVGGPAVSAVD